jgi:hypothetical protein
MRIYARGNTRLVWVATLGAGLALLGPAAGHTGEAARDLAERFAEPGHRRRTPVAGRAMAPKAARPSTADEQRLLDEIDMLERARAEAETRRMQLLKAREAAEGAERGAGPDPLATAERARLIEAERQAAEQQVEATRKVEEARRIATERAMAEEASRIVDEQRREEESRRIAEEQRRAEESRRIADEQRRAEEARRFAEEQRRAEEASRIADEQRRAEESRRVADEQQRSEERQRAGMAAEREAEAERIAEALRAARAAHADRGPADTYRSAGETGREGHHGSSASGRSGDAGDPRLAEHYAASGRADGGRSRLRQATRVTVLLRLEPGNYGIRRHNRTADPLLCSDQGCFVSAGADEAADLLRKRRALGVRRTLGLRAGACSNSLGCVFRDVELGAYPAIVQPVDMHVLKHDRRQPQVLHETSDCRVTSGRLDCGAPFRGPDYVMWIIPEDVATAAGSAALIAMVEDDERVGAEPAAFRSWR